MEDCIGPRQRRGPIQPSEGHYDLIRVITKLPNSEQSYKGKVKTHNFEIDWLIKVLRNGCFHNGSVICPRFGALKSDSTHHFFRNACTKSGSLRFSVSGCIDHCLSFCPFPVATVMSVLLRFTDFDYHVHIFKK
jgi:hypothetical protein